MQIELAAVRYKLSVRQQTNGATARDFLWPTGAERLAGSANLLLDNAQNH
jgi:hypothetical protein